MSLPAGVEAVALPLPGIVAFTTTRARGDFNIMGERPAGDVASRWLTLQDELGVARFAYAKQVHGRRVVVHEDTWSGWLRVADADGHIALAPGTALAVTLADCVPIFIAHPNGIALLHAGWRGVAGGIVEQAAHALVERGIAVHDCHVHLGPAICGACYEVGPDVLQTLSGERADRPGRVDLRKLLGAQLKTLGATRVSVSEQCTRHHNEHFFSHRAGDKERHIGVIARIA
ncbi:MAG TPA: polyphenol oxidase family protein [Gemmatimonadaceae bacterium]|nr:polyphenol oxidase family protein [Gemmatimonadaceae bacterium]